MRLALSLILIPAVLGFTPLSSTQRNLAYQITSAWENEIYNHSSKSWVLQFDYCENIFDGQGITIGFTGFTSSGGDAMAMIQRYHSINPHNPFAKVSGLMSCLNSVQNSGSTHCFKCKDRACHSSTICNAAKAAYAHDRINYMKAQVEQDANDNWGNALTLAQKYNILIPISQAFLYDSCVNHACDYSGNDVEGYIIRRALKGAKQVGSSLKAQKAFFNNMLSTRRSYMCSNGCQCCGDSKWRIPGWNWIANNQGHWNLPNAMSIKTFQDGSSAQVFSFQCSPAQFPGCGAAASPANASISFFAHH